MSKRKDAIEEAAGIAEGIFWLNQWCYPGEADPPDFYDCVALIKGLSRVLRRFPTDAPQFLEAGHIRLQADHDDPTYIGIYVSIGGFREKA